MTKNADGDHGCATTDFRAIAPDHDTLPDFDELLAQAHRRGIGVIMETSFDGLRLEAVPHLVEASAVL